MFKVGSRTGNERQFLYECWRWQGTQGTSTGNFFTDIHHLLSAMADQIVGYHRQLLGSGTGNQQSMKTSDGC